MSASGSIGTPLPPGVLPEPNSLREALQERHGRGQRHSLSEAVAIVVPLCLAAANAHKAGKTFFLSPSCIKVNEGDPTIDNALGQIMPTIARDKACVAPESKGGTPGGARASVFAVGAILYELLTGKGVGPGMARPSELVPSLPEAFEAVLGKALVADPAHRPDDLGALASALHGLAPSASVAPPPADESSLDGDDEFEVDIRLSLMPPASPSSEAPIISGAGIGAVVEAPKSARRAGDPTAALADLKARLESDGRPRYVVVKDGMDHGPFSAVELLRQIGTGQFLSDHVLRDEISNEEKPISDWEEFSPFAQQAKLHEDIKAEKVALEESVEKESKATRSKAIIGAAAIAGALLIVGVLVMVSRGTRGGGAKAGGDRAVAVDAEGDVKSGSGAAKGGKRKYGKGPLPKSGKFPILPGGLSCEGARARYVEEMKLGGGGPADLTRGQLGGVMNNGAYLNSCGVPEATKVSICAAVQNGRAVGVTVRLDPPNRGIASCVAARVRGLSFPSNPKLDIVNTRF